MTNQDYLPTPETLVGLNQDSQVPEPLVLQRGGEELILDKVADRFTLQTNAPEVLEQLIAQIPAQASQRVPPARSIEFIVGADRLDQVMTWVRQQPGVNFVSHVYQLKGTPGSLVYLTNEVTIQFSSEGVRQKDEITTPLGLQTIRPLSGVSNTFIFEVTNRATLNPIKLANCLVKYPTVLVVEPNIVIQHQPHYRPKDSLYPRQWYLSNNGGADLVIGSHISVEQAWDITRGDRSVVVAVVDDSFDLNHPDFQGAGKVVFPKDFKQNDNLPLPDSSETSHGTACAGVALAEENGVGVVGVAPGCAFMPIRTTGFLDDRTIEDLFDWAAQKGASVISCSWGPAAVKFSLTLRQKAAITRAATEGRQGKGCVIVFAAGNSNRPVNGKVMERGWPKNAVQGATDWLAGFANHPDVLAVSACTSQNKKAAYSNWGAQISVCAPSNNAPPNIWLPQTGFVETPPEITSFLRGMGIFTTDQLGAAGYNQAGDFTGEFGGTSSACPIVAGVAALVLSANPNLTALEVRQILEQTADKIVDADPDPQLGLRHGTYSANGHSQWFGYGKVNAFKAVKAAKDKLAPPKATDQYPQTLRRQNTVPVNIPDGDSQGALSRIDINQTGNIKDILVTIDLTHEFLGDLSIHLITPTGQALLLQGRTLGRLTQHRQVYSHQTTLALKQAINQPAQGSWQLHIIDHVPQDKGRLNSWDLAMTVTG